MDKPLIPIKLSGKLSKLDFLGLAHLYEGRYSEAQQVFEEQLGMLFAAQTTDDTRYHKGGPLHNLGLALLFQRRIGEGVRHVVAALAEDVTSFGRMESQDYPAYRLLLELGINQSALQDLTGLLHERNSELLVARDSLRFVTLKESIVALFGYDLIVPKSLPASITPQAASSPPSRVISKVKKCLAKIGGTPQDHVFVGGAYRNIALLRYVADLIGKSGILMPILVIDLPVKFKDEESYYASMELLRHCKSAVFEVSFSNGHMMELEKCHDLKNTIGMEVLMAWQVPERKKNKSIDQSIPSRMLITEHFDKCCYINLEELRIAVDFFLSSRVLKTAGACPTPPSAPGLYAPANSCIAAYSTSSGALSSVDTNSSWLPTRVLHSGSDGSPSK